MVFQEIENPLIGEYVQEEDQPSFDNYGKNVCKKKK